MTRRSDKNRIRKKRAGHWEVVKIPVTEFLSRAWIARDREPNSERTAFPLVRLSLSLWIDRKFREEVRAVACGCCCRNKLLAVRGRADGWGSGFKWFPAQS